MSFANQLTTAAEARITPHGTVVLADQSATGRAVMLAILDRMAGPRRPVLSDLERARMDRGTALCLYGEAAILAAEAAGYATPMAKRFGAKMSPAERLAADEAQAGRVAS